MNITDSFALFQFLWLAVYENRRKAISGSSYYIYRCVSIIPTQLYSISDIQTVSYCRGYLSGTVQASDTSVTISYLQDLFYLKSIDFKPQQDNLHQPLYI